jgi:hypothetical protein
MSLLAAVAALVHTLCCPSQRWRCCDSCSGGGGGGGGGNSMAGAIGIAKHA